MYTHFRSVLNYEYNDCLFSQVYESRPDDASGQILHCIEKQALVQIIIKEFAKLLVPEKYIFVVSVSPHSS